VWPKKVANEGGLGPWGGGGCCAKIIKYIFREEHWLCENSMSSLLCVVTLRKLFADVSGQHIGRLFSR